MAGYSYRKEAWAKRDMNGSAATQFGHVSPGSEVKSIDPEGQYIGNIAITMKLCCFECAITGADKDMDPGHEPRS